MGKHHVLVVHPDLFVLAGDCRAMLMFADVFKYLGHHVLFLYTDIRPRRAWYFTLSELKNYHAVKYLDTEPCNREGVCGDFQMKEHRHLRTQVYDYLVKLEEFDTLFTDLIALSFIADDDAPVNGILYVHYPYRPAGPLKVKLWANSTYIASLTEERWGRRPKVVHPPLHLDMYKPWVEYEDRDYDVVFFGQFYAVKGFHLARKLADMGFRVAVIGAKVSNYHPGEGSVTSFSNVTVGEYIDILSRSKVYIHARPGEHFGITITEAMASGVPIVVHRSGGQWSDIAAYGKYGHGFSSEKELFMTVKRLVTDKEYWIEWHKRALVGVKRFSFEKIAQEVSVLL